MTNGLYLNTSKDISDIAVTGTDIQLFCSIRGN